MANITPVSDLYPARYSAGRTKVYGWMSKLGITTFKPTGQKQAFIEAADRKRLDEYARIFNEQGAEAADAYAAESLPQAAIAPIPDASEPLATVPPIEGLITAIATQLAPAAQQDIFAPQRQLQEAWREGWLISTPQLRAILGVQQPTERECYGFKVVRERRGWWGVRKLP